MNFITRRLQEWRTMRQFKKAGADSAEAAKLAALSSRLGDGVPGMDRSRKDEIARHIGFKPAHVALQRRLELGGAFAVFLLVVLVAQTALPGTPLYAIKRGSEEVISTVNPGFEDTIVNRREAELESLKRSKADKSAIEQAKDAYDAARKEAKEQEKQQKDDSGKGSDDQKVDDNSGSGSGSGNSGGSGSSGSGNSGSSGSGRDHPEDD